VPPADPRQASEDGERRRENRWKETGGGNRRAFWVRYFKDIIVFTMIKEWAGNIKLADIKDEVLDQAIKLVILGTEYANMFRTRSDSLFLVRAVRYCFWLAEGVFKLISDRDYH